MFASPAPQPVCLSAILQPQPIQVPGTDIVTERPFVVSAAPTSTMFLGTMGADRAEELLKPYAPIKPVRLAGQAVVAATGFNYTKSPSGAYNEAVVTVLASPDGKMHFADLPSFLQFFAAPQAMTQGDLLTMPTSPFVFAATDLFLDKEEPVQVGRRLMHLPKDQTEVIFTGNNPREQKLDAYSYPNQETRLHLLSARAQSNLPITLREFGIVGKPARWMRFRVATRLPKDTGPTTMVDVVVHADKMTLDLIPMGGLLAFGGPKAAEYGPVSFLGALRFINLQAGFNYPEHI